MSRRTTVPACLVAVLAATLVGAAPTAQAAQDVAPVVHGADVRQQIVVLGNHDATRITVDVEATDDVAVEGVLAGLYRGDSVDEAVEGILLERFSRIEGTNTWRASTWVDKTYPTGKYRLAAFAFDADGNSSEADRLDTVYVKRNTTMPTFDVGPEPATKGARLEVSGRLERLSADHGYVGYAGKRIDVQFKPTGGTWTAKGSATTDAAGRWTRTVTASTSGTWRAVFAGTANYHAETSRADVVEVR